MDDVRGLFRLALFRMGEIVSIWTAREMSGFAASIFEGL
jgi:hypothetical protein